MESALAIGTTVSTPLMLAGFVAGAFFLIVRTLIQKNIFPTLTRSLSSGLIKVIIDRFFWLAMVGMVLGFAGFVLGRLVPEPAKHRFAAPRADMIKLEVEGAWSIDLAPRPEMKNVVLRVKVLPRADGFTPLSQTAALVVSSQGAAPERFPFSINVDPEGVAPKIKSYIAADGLLPRARFKELISAQPPPLAHLEVEYDKDVNAVGLKFRSDPFEFTSRFVEEQTK